MTCRTHIGKPPRRARRDRWLMALCAAAVLAGAGCGGELDPECNGTGRIGLQLVWNVPDQPPEALRGIADGVCFTMHVSVGRNGKEVADNTCDYDEYSCSLTEIPGCSGYDVKVECLNEEGAVLYEGTALDETVIKDQINSVEVVMRQVYDDEDDKYPPAAVTDLEASFDGTKINLVWTATGDDCRLGRVDSYKIWYSTTGEVTEDRLDPDCLGPDCMDPGRYVVGPIPKDAGEEQESPLLESTAGVTYYIKLKGVDDVKNESELSNSAEVGIPD